MPIHVGADMRRLDDEEFGAVVYEVMRHIFAIHNDLGRLFDEKIYQRELAYRAPDVQREVPFEVSFDNFRKTYYLDLLVSSGAIFELKAAASLAQQHRGQLLSYLFLAGLPHGKLVNFRPDRVEHEFVNNTLTAADRTSFAIVDEDWQELGTDGVKEGMVAMLRDWGVGLELALYEAVVAYLCGQSLEDGTDVEIRAGSRSLGTQRMRLAAPGVAMRITALPPKHQPDYEVHLCRLLAYTDLKTVQWINITRPCVQFRTIRKTGI